MSKIRTFVAISPGKIPSLNRWLEELKKHHAEDKVKWTDNHQWHVTLRFVGDIEASELPELINRLTSAFNKVKAGEMVVQGSGFFGSAASPKVLWAGIRENEWLADLQKRTVEACSEFGFSGESGSFHPHLTLARIKFLKDRSRLIEEVNRNKNTIWCLREINQVTLFQSKLTQKGPLHSVLKQFELE